MSVSFEQKVEEFKVLVQELIKSNYYKSVHLYTHTRNFDGIRNGKFNIFYKDENGLDFLIKTDSYNKFRITKDDGRYYILSTFGIRTLTVPEPTKGLCHLCWEISERTALEFITEAVEVLKKGIELLKENKYFVSSWKPTILRKKRHFIELEPGKVTSVSRKEAEIALTGIIENIIRSDQETRVKKILNKAPPKTFPSLSKIYDSIRTIP